MKAHLLWPDADFDPNRARPWNEAELRQDLGLDIIVATMAGGDSFLADVAWQVLLAPASDPQTVHYRLDTFGDAIANPQIFHAIYDLCGGALSEERHIWGTWMGSPTSVLSQSVRVLEMLLTKLHELRELADIHAHTCRSAALTNLLRMLPAELDDAYFDTVQGHLKQARFKHGVLVSAGLGSGNTGIDYVLHAGAGRPDESWLTRLTGRGEPSYSFTIPPRDDAGARALAHLRDVGLNHVANALAQSRDHILNFVQLLRAETGFYLGCLNLYDRLREKAGPVCRPQPAPIDERIFRTRKLYDVGLALRLDQRVTGNDVDADGTNLIVVTGANQGGKSTFLRSAAIAQLMMQAGMFVGAEGYTASMRSGIVTHFKREEDTSMTSGKFDEELGRMRDIVEHIASGHLLLSNESFSSTNEREGSEIGWQIIHALLDSGVHVICVTHLFDLADTIRREARESTLFLRAERGATAQRSYRLVVGEPLPTAFGADLYARIFHGSP